MRARAIVGTARVLAYVLILVVGMIELDVLAFCALSLGLAAGTVLSPGGDP